MKLLAIDGNSIINRAFYGVAQLTAGDGTPTGAVYGFLTILQKLIEEESPDALCVMFDLKDKTFRHMRYEGYKAQRTGMPDELAVQMPILKEILDVMNISRMEVSGWEADDLLGTMASLCEKNSCDCVIVTGDKDALQLITDKTNVKHIKTQKGRTETRDYTPIVFFEEYGFEPPHLVDLKALMGDTSDNIPGVKGVGEKTARDLISRFGTIADIYEKIDELDIKDSVRKKLKDGEDNARLSYELAEIHRDAPLAYSADDYALKTYNKEKLLPIFKRLGFSKLIEKYGLNETESISAGEVTFTTEIIIKKADLDALLESLQKSEYVTITAENDFSSSAIFCCEKVFLLKKGETEDYDNALKLILGPTVKKAGHNIKDTMRRALEYGFETEGWIFDTALAAYLVSPVDSSYDIERIAARYAGYIMHEQKNGGQMSFLESGKEGDYAYAIGLLKPILSEKLTEMELNGVFYDIELPLCRVLAEMEHTGFLVDRNALVRYGEKLSIGIRETEKVIYELAGEEFNINSPKQLGVILFDKLMLPPPKKTKTGYSTSVEVLDSLLEKHPIIASIKDYRDLTKLKSTYADGLLKVARNDGRIHTRFQMTVTATGRLSSIEPNLQNIPIRKPSGEELRKMFVAENDSVLVGADYSQIELRLLAHIASDPVMQSAFEKGVDIHTVTASQVFDTPLDSVTMLMRSRAKAVNFGIVYGISAFSLAKDIDVSVQEAKKYIENYLNKYAGVSKYMKDVVEKAKQDGFVTTLYGRRRALPELKSQRFNERSFGERVALNMPIQGTAADIIKIAMINVFNRLKKERPSAKLILQVHDELIVECLESEAEAVGQILCEEMEHSATLSVPLIAETHSGKSWHDAK